ncbi:hypothetical protein MSAN_01309600 [Mycena sanguinolenta]|uniref:Ubiquinol-cytochrome C reductase hinge domain-containing protein n=1 Tax=Mycena sanguinolenta TaxID=230812 RepID=A0A8H6YA09_9AGAR|nr:hypothetical protein MSAN_01309600 [Mycena sanguinolenta]
MSGIGSFLSSFFPTTHADAPEEKPAEDSKQESAEETPKEEEEEPKEEEAADEEEPEDHIHVFTDDFSVGVTVSVDGVFDVFFRTVYSCFVDVAGVTLLSDSDLTPGDGVIVFEDGILVITCDTLVFFVPVPVFCRPLRTGSDLEHPKIREECESSSACAPMKHHFEKCQEKVRAGQGYKGEDCVDELCVYVLSLPVPPSFDSTLTNDLCPRRVRSCAVHLMHCSEACAAPKLFAKLR